MRALGVLECRQHACFIGQRGNRCASRSRPRVQVAPDVPMLRQSLGAAARVLVSGSLRLLHGRVTRLACTWRLTMRSGSKSSGRQVAPERSHPVRSAVGHPSCGNPPAGRSPARRMSPGHRGPATGGRPIREMIALGGTPVRPRPAPRAGGTATPSRRRRCGCRTSAGRNRHSSRRRRPRIGLSCEHPRGGLVTPQNKDGRSQASGQLERNQPDADRLNWTGGTRSG